MRVSAHKSLWREGIGGLLTIASQCTNMPVTATKQARKEVNEGLHAAITTHRSRPPASVMVGLRALCLLHFFASCQSVTAGLG